MNVLLTGRAGYIGSHTTVALAEAGHHAVIFDNFSNSCRGAVGQVEKIVGRPVVAIEGDVLDADLLVRSIQSHVIDAVIHFAGLKAVGESFEAPVSYYANNVQAAITPQYTVTVGELARQLQSFKDSRISLMADRVGVGLTRALYSTYVSYLPVESFAYEIPQHADPRGVFVEMLKTPDCGQFSFFTAHPGVTRGGHYHHSKTEKFLVIRGDAKFRFRHMQTGQVHELLTNGARSQIVETVPGWTHDITNVGEGEMVVMLWANEVFDRARPDTFACPV